MSKPKIWSIIPARSGSKGLPNKNIKPFIGKPLIAWTIEASLNSKEVSGTFVSTDSIEIANVSKEYGASVPFLRPDDLANDHSSVLDAVKHFIVNSTFINNDDYILLLQPTSPLRTSHHIDLAVRELVNDYYEAGESLVSVTKAPEKTGWLLEQSDKYINFCFPVDRSNPQRQKLKSLFLPNGSLYLAQVKNIQNGFYTDKTRFFVMDNIDSIDIDTLEEFEEAERLMKKKY